MTDDSAILMQAGRNMSASSTQDASRYVSRMTRETLALILAGGQGSRLHELTSWRAKPSLYFGAWLRIIDFPLSKCVNSGIRRIGVLTQYKAHSLIRHLVHGWTRFQADNKEFVEILPASQRVVGDWYRGTADAVYPRCRITVLNTDASDDGGLSIGNPERIESVYVESQSGPASLKPTLPPLAPLILKQAVKRDTARRRE